MKFNQGNFHNFQMNMNMNMFTQNVMPMSQRSNINQNVMTNNQNLNMVTQNVMPMSQRSNINQNVMTNSQNRNMFNQNVMPMNQRSNINQNVIANSQNRSIFNQNVMPMNQRNNINQNVMANNQNRNMFNQNVMPMNQRSNINQNLINNQNMNMMTNNNQNFKNFENNNKGMNIINDFPQKNMANNNIKTNNSNNNNNNSNLQHLKKQLLKNSLSLKDPFKIQMSIALGLNNNKPYEHYVQGGNKVPDFMTQSSNENPNGIEFDDKINIVFVVMKGHNHNRLFNKNDTIGEMLLKAIKSFGLQEYHLNYIYFLFNAVNLKTINQNLTLMQYGIKNGSKITVLDLKDIIGA